MWAGSIGKKPASSPLNSGFMYGEQPKGNAPSPYGVASNAPSPYGVASNAPSPYGVASNAPSPYGVASNSWATYESDKGGDSPSATQIAAVSALADALKAQEVENNGSTNPQLEGMSYPNNSNRRGGSQTPVKSTGGPPSGFRGDEPPVQTDTTLIGQKGGDECVYTEDQIAQIRYDLAKAEEELMKINIDITSKGVECNKIQAIQKQKNENNNMFSLINKCRPIIKKENAAGKKLKNLQKGTVSYSKQLDYIYGLRNEVKACFRKNKIKTEYKRMFITQMYDSNEYEGDISVFDKNWDKGDELIHDCDD